MNPEDWEISDSNRSWVSWLNSSTWEWEMWVSRRHPWPSHLCPLTPQSWVTSPGRDRECCNPASNTHTHTHTHEQSVTDSCWRRVAYHLSWQTHWGVAFAEAASVLGPDLGDCRLGDVGSLFCVVQLMNRLPVLGQIHVRLLLLGIDRYMLYDWQLDSFIITLQSSDEHSVCVYSFIFISASKAMFIIVMNIAFEVDMKMNE